MAESIINQISELHVVVIGDVMIDEYLWGHVNRISPEAPVPVVEIEKTENRLGGAANVALNCKVLGAKVSLASVIGTDLKGNQLVELLEENEIQTDLLFREQERITSTKTRVFSKNQQLLRYDQEQTEDLNLPLEHAFIDRVLRYLQIEKPHAVIFEDYNKGVLKPNIIKKIIQHCQHLGIITAVDPKFKNFFHYQEVTIFKPNLKEIKEALSMNFSAIDEGILTQAHDQLFQELQHQLTLITLSEKGIFFKNKNQQKWLPAQHRVIADVSGAGDTVIAVATLIYTLTKDAYLMALYANIAGGLVCEEVGVVPINKQKFISELNKLSI